MPLLSRPITTYGLSPDAHVRGENVQADGTRMRFTVQRHDRATALPPLAVELNPPGLHHVRNALAAVGLATQLGVTDDANTPTLVTFLGVGTRFRPPATCPDPCATQG